MRWIEVRVNKVDDRWGRGRSKERRRVGYHRSREKNGRRYPIIEFFSFKYYWFWYYKAEIENVRSFCCCFCFLALILSKNPQIYPLSFYSCLFSSTNHLIGNPKFTTDEFKVIYFKGGFFSVQSDILLRRPWFKFPDKLSF